MRILILFFSTFLLTACDSSEHQPIKDKEAFRKELLEKALNDDTRKAGDAFLAENKLREGVVETKSGLQYRVIEEGSGISPRVDQVVEVSYEGRLVNGHVFDSTKPGKTVKFPLNQVISGWREGLSLMQVGAEWELYLPADIAYGARSPSTDIPANSALIFNVKLLGVSDAGEQE